METLSSSGNGAEAVGNLPPDQVKARLFYHLAEFLIWGQGHTEITAAHPDLERLLRTTADALATAGTLEAGAA
jgi:hypothetical protein